MPRFPLVPWRIRALFFDVLGRARRAVQTGTNPLIAVLSPRFSSHKEKTINWDRVEGNWKQFKGQVQQKWGKLTDDDLDVIEGKRTELAGRLQQRYGYARDEVEKNIDTWLKTLN